LLNQDEEVLDVHFPPIDLLSLKLVLSSRPPAVRVPLTYTLQRVMIDLASESGTMSGWTSFEGETLLTFAWLRYKNKKKLLIKRGKMEDAALYK
jgi:hypothetical protein